MFTVSELSRIACHHVPTGPPSEHFSYRRDVLQRTTQTSVTTTFLDGSKDVTVNNHVCYGVHINTLSLSQFTYFHCPAD